MQQHRLRTLSVLLFSLGLSQFSFAADTLKIGVGVPLTGRNAAFGDQIFRGAQQAAEDINAAGGVDGKKIELIKGDDACEPKQAVSVAQRFVEVDKVQAEIGHFCSSSTIPATEVYAEAGILAITPGSTNPKVTERNLPTIFRACGRDDQQGKVAAEYIINKLKAKKVVLVHDKDTYGQGIADSVRTNLQKLGVTESLYEGLTRGEKDFNALVTKIKALNPDAVYFGGLYNEAGLLVRQLREQGVKAAFIAGDGIVSEDFVTAAGGKQFSQGVYMTFGADSRKLPSGKAVVEKFRKAGFEPEGYTLYAYTAMQAIAAAVQGAKSTDGMKLSAWLKANTVKTVMGDKAWDEKGDLKVTDYVMYQWDNNGKYAEVAP
jgi:branched-chain amino acid transport system substrate-binding protein